MNEALTALAALIFMAVIGRMAAFGPLTPKECQKRQAIENFRAGAQRRPRRVLRVFYNGVDITKRCYYADDTIGIADRFLPHPEHGGAYVIAGEVASERLYGNVKIRWVKHNENNQTS